MKSSDVSIVIPAYNEEQGLGPLLKELVSVFPDAEIIVVNDGSEDGTAQVARDAGVRVIEHDRNRGYGAALRTGTEHADRDYVLFCDSDGQHTVTDVGRVIEACTDHDMVVGARGQDSHAPLLRRPGKLIRCASR